jgi:cell division protease FtsH
MVEAGEVTVTFRDVAGCDEVVQELKEIESFLSDPERFRELGASIPKGVLLFGPPGTGKTLLARAVAGEAGVPFFSISGSDFVEMYVGVGASRVRKLFEAAKQQAPCVVFIDEIDAVGRRRSGMAQGGQEERENTLNQLLVEIDGFAPTDNVIIMAASNRADILDPALTRPGRFDRQVIVDSPDRKGRLEILKVHGADKPFAKGVELETIAAQTAGFNGADLANLINEAALLAARNNRKEITAYDLDEAIMRVLAGPQKNRLITDQEKRTIATHEIGHALVANELPEVDPVHKVTIVSRGRALGLMVSLQEGDRLLRTRRELMSRMAVALGGRVAEEIMFSDITTGAANDLEQVNEIAHAMVLQYGMSESFPLRSFIHEEQMVAHSNQLRAKIDSEIDALVGEAKLIAQEILLARKADIERLSDALIERETLERSEFELLVEGGELPPMEIVYEPLPHNVIDMRSNPVRDADVALRELRGEEEETAASAEAAA